MKTSAPVPIRGNDRRGRCQVNAADGEFVSGNVFLVLSWLDIPNKDPRFDIEQWQRGRSRHRHESDRGRRVVGKCVALAYSLRENALICTPNVPNVHRNGIGGYDVRGSGAFVKVA
jgi:hypothetical protein